MVDTDELFWSMASALLGTILLLSAPLATCCGRKRKVKPPANRSLTTGHSHQQTPIATSSSSGAKVDAKADARADGGINKIGDESTNTVCTLPSIQQPRTNDATNRSSAVLAPMAATEAKPDERNLLPNTVAVPTYASAQPGDSKMKQKSMRKPVFDDATLKEKTPMFRQQLHKRDDDKPNISETITEELTETNTDCDQTQSSADDPMFFSLSSDESDTLSDEE